MPEKGNETTPTPTPILTPGHIEGIHELAEPKATPTQAELAVLRNQISKDAEALRAEFVTQCDRHLIEMNVEEEGSSVPFKFPYIENGVVKLADGVMEAERMILGGHAYTIEAPMLIVLTNIAFPAGYNGTTEMSGKLGGIIPAPVSADVKTSDLYVFLNTLRQGIKPGSTLKLDTFFGPVKFTAMPSHVARL